MRSQGLPRFLLSQSNNTRTRGQLLPSHKSGSVRVSVVKINGTRLLDTLSRCSASLAYSGCTYPAPLLLLSAPIASASWPPAAVELVLMFLTAGSFSVEAVDVASAAVAETPCVSAVTCVDRVSFFNLRVFIKE